MPGWGVYDFFRFCQLLHFQFPFPFLLSLSPFPFSFPFLFLSLPLSFTFIDFSTKPLLNVMQYRSVFLSYFSPDCQWARSGQRGRIFGGRVWPKSQAAWQAMIWDNFPRIKGSFVRCGAIVLHKRYVLTAAHCVDGITEENLQNQRFVVKTGKQRAYRVDPGEQTRAISSIAIHRQFNNLTFENDIAVLYLDRALRLELNNTSTIRLPDIDSSDFCLEQQGSSGVLTGWGRVSPLRSARTLRGVLLPVINTTVCRQAYPGWPVTRGMFCAGYGLGQKDACHGDSGGPVAAYSIKRREWVLIGIISWGSERCAQPDKYTVSTRVSHYIEWINNATTCLKLDKPIHAPPHQVTLLSTFWKLCRAHHRFIIP